MTKNKWAKVWLIKFQYMLMMIQKLYTYYLIEEEEDDEQILLIFFFFFLLISEISLSSVLWLEFPLGFEVNNNDCNIVFASFL